MHVADLGVGNGVYALSIARKVGDTGKVYAIDIQNDLLTKLQKQAAAEHLENIETIWSDIEHTQGTTLKDGAIDAVIITNTFFQIEKKESVVIEISRILHSKGRVLVIEWADSFAGMGPHKDLIVKEELVKNLFLDNGFEFDRDIDAGDHHYGIVMRKK